MISELTIAEENFQKFLPILEDLYPEDRKDKAAVRQFIQKYQEMMILNNVVVGLFDSPNASLIHLSDNFEKIVGYKKSTILNWGGLLMFRLIPPAHYSFPFVAFREGRKFYKNITSEQSKKTNISIGGLKIIDSNRKTRIAFLKLKTLIWTPEGNPDLMIIYGEDITHLMKNGHYWLRYETPHKTYAYIHQKGKKRFNDLISNSERKILKLIAEKKTNAEIADELHLSKLTIETHRKNMIKKVGAVNSTALAHICKMANII